MKHHKHITIIRPDTKIRAISDLSVAGKMEWLNILRILILENFLKDSCLFWNSDNFHLYGKSLNITINFFPTGTLEAIHTKISNSISDMESGDENMCTFAEQH